MITTQAQEKTRLQYNLGEFGEKSNISPVLQALIFAINAIAGGIIGFSVVGLAGLSIGVLMGIGGAFFAIAIANSCIRQPKDLLLKPAGNDEALTDFIDPNPDEMLVNFYDQIQIKSTTDQDLRPQFDGPINIKAEKIRDWMKGPEVQNWRGIFASNLGIKQLPKEIGLFINLEHLDLSNNKLEVLPAEIANLQSITHLILSRNNFKSLPPQICDLRSLRHLEIRQNDLQALPARIDNLRSLHTLWLYDNKLKGLPPEILALESLKDLELTKNQFQAIPAEIGACRSLETFAIFDNPLESPPPNHIGNLFYNGFFYSR